MKCVELAVCPRFRAAQTLKTRYDEIRLFKFPPKRWFSSFATATGKAALRVWGYEPRIIRTRHARTRTDASQCVYTLAVEQRRRVFEVFLQELLCLQPRPTGEWRQCVLTALLGL